MSEKNPKLKLLDLFSGIPVGGFSLGLERTGGFETVAFCEIDPFCRKVLNKHWPKVPIYEDVTKLTAEQLRADGITVDAICGGFPCQDISIAGKGAGIEGERSGLWSEYARIIGELRPRFVIVENVSALLSRGLDRVLGDLATLGFDAEWHCIPASAVGAPHRRDRLWLVAYADSRRGRANTPRWNDANGTDTRRAQANGLSGEICSSDAPRITADAYESVRAGGLAGGEDCSSPSGSEGGHLSEGQAQHGQRVWLEPGASSSLLANPQRQRLQGRAGRGQQSSRRPPIIITSFGEGVGRQWEIEPNVGRVAYGVPSAMDRIKSLGNAVVPQIPEIIGNAILDSLKQQREAA